MRYKPFLYRVYIIIMNEYQKWCNILNSLNLNWFALKFNNYKFNCTLFIISDNC
mgnify:CR=1 FL=1